MGFRTVIVNSRSKLEFRLNYLVIRGETEKRVFIGEINTLIVQSTAVSLTAALLSELVRNNVKVIFCDEKCTPHSELVPYYAAHNTSKRYKEQAAWKQSDKDRVWQKIIRRKIRGQSDLLRHYGFTDEAEMLRGYMDDVTEGDETNREGHAAKVYFNCILPEGVGRRDGGFINACLNYGYAVLLSAFNREIAASGYLTQFGIWHDNEFNQFNLSSDLMEPLRVVVDETALSLEIGDADFKKKMANVLNYPAVSDGKSTTLDVAVRNYVRSAIAALSGECERELDFPENVTRQNL